MAEPARKPMTADEFLDWDDGTDTRHELVDGLVLAMAPTTDAHGTIAVNAALEINGRLDGRPPCRAIAEAGIRLDDGNHYEADVAATCAEPRGGRYVEEPFLIVEVLSESTEDRDLGVKLQRYLELSHLREIWLIDSRKRWTQVWRRAGDDWVVSLPTRGSAGFASEALGGAPVALDRLYRNTGL
jgi:Uma2 family endonuclease